MEDIIELRKSSTQNEIGDLEANRIPIALKFEVDQENSIIIGSDTAAFLSYYHQIYNAYEGAYRGIIEIEDFAILIFDEGNVGHRFYNNGALKEKSIEEIPRPNISLAITNVYKISNGDLSR